MQFKFEQLANKILNEGIGDPEAEAQAVRDHNRALRDRHEAPPVTDRAFRSRERNAGLEWEDAHQPYKIKVTWKGGGKSYLKAGGSDVIYKGTPGYHKAMAKCKSLKENPKVEDALPVPVFPS